MKKNIWKRICAVGLAAVMTMGLAVTGFADDSDKVPDSSKLTVHKYLSTANPSNTGDGLKITDASTLASFGEVGANVVFKLTKLDETKLENTTTVSSIKDEMKTSTIYYAKTDANGEAGTWYSSYDEGTSDVSGIPYTQLDKGYYYLEEIKGADGYKVAQPSIITLPYGVVASGSTTKYNTDVHVYPKNVSDSPINKEVVNKGDLYKQGDAVQWKITGDLRQGKLKVTSDTGTTTYGTYSISDTLDSRLTYDTTNGTVVTVNQKGSTGTATLTKDTDYELILNDQTIKVKLTHTGIDKIENLGSNSIFVTINTTVNGSAFSSADEDVITNGASMEFDPDGDEDQGDAETKEVPDGQEAYVAIPTVRITKVDSKDDNTKLAGAQFKIAYTEAEAKAGTFIKKRNANNQETSEEMLITTGDDGIANFSGIPYDTENAQHKAEITYDETDATKIKSINFYLVETTQPTGYVLSQNVYKVTLEKTTSETTVGSGSDATTVVRDVFKANTTIKNYKVGDPEGDKNFNLPLTGGRGVIVCVIAGAALILGGSFVLFKLRRYSLKAVK